MPDETTNQVVEFTPNATAPSALPSVATVANPAPILSVPSSLQDAFDKRKAGVDRQNFQPVVLMPTELWGPIMGAYDSIYATSSFQYAQFNIDRLIAQKGYKIFDEMLTMGACRNPFEVKRAMVLSEKGLVVPSKNGIPIIDPTDRDFERAQEIADFCSYSINNIVDEGDLPQDFSKVLYEMLRAVWDGFHVTDIVYKIFENGPYKGKTGYRYFASKPAREIGWELDLYTMGVRNIMPYTPMSGYEPPRPVEKVMLYTYNPNEGLPYGQGDGRACYKHYLMLDNLLKFWVVAMERWGSPVLVLKYPGGNTEALAAAQQIAGNIRQGSPPVFPDNVEYELVKVDANNFEGFKHFADWNVEQINQNVLGSTLTTSEGDRVGSMALGHVHQDTQRSRVDSVTSDVENIVHLQLFRRLVRYNFGADYEYLAPTYSLRGDALPSNALDIAQSLDYLLRDGNMSAFSPQIRKSLNLPPMSKSEYNWSKSHSVPPDKALQSKSTTANVPSRRDGAAATDPNSADKGSNRETGD